MSKKNYHTPATKTREAHPIPRPNKDGIDILCPFCKPPHPIVPGKPTLCGTRLHVTAVQEIISARTVRIEGLTCIKCRETGRGEMVRYMNGFVHVEECAPEISLLTEIPEFSRTAKIIYNLPERIRTLLEKLTGQTQKVHGLDPDGKETEEIIGYFFAQKAKA